MTKYTSYEEGCKGTYTLEEIKTLYATEVDKEEYLTFEDWLLDMLRSGVFEEVEENPQEIFENNMKKLNSLNAIKNAMVLADTLKEYQTPFNKEEVLKWCEKLEKSIRENL